MYRRDFVLAIAALGLTPTSAKSQRSQKIFRIGILHSDSAEGARRRVVAFTRELQIPGYVEGKNIAIERRFADGNRERLPALASTLIAQKVDIIFSPNYLTTVAAKAATATIPIVFSSVGDPVGMGFIASLSHPGGNITGISNIAPELSAKRLEILKEAIPKISRVAYFMSDRTGEEWMALQPAAKKLGIELLSTNLASQDQGESRSALLRNWRANAILVAAGPTNAVNRKLIIDFAMALRIPTIGLTEEFTGAGGLISYGTSFEDLYRRAAALVDKILKGAKPADLPVERPTRFDLVINIKSAKELGIRIPQTMLVRTNRVLE